MQDIILNIRGVSKFYTGKTALENVDIAVPRGSIFGLLGPNGAGKTTLIRIINQITETDRGEVLLNGEKLNPAHIRDIGYLPEERGLYKKLKVGRQLQYFARLKGLSYAQAHEQAEYWLKKMQLQDVRNKKTEELSKGMQQKIQFIVAVIHKPSLLILDEPFSGFDPVNAELLTAVIRELRSAGCTIIFSTHRMESVEQLCDSMAMLHLSRKILDGKVQEIRERFSNGTYILETEKPLITDGIAECLQSETTERGYWRYTLKPHAPGTNAFLSAVMQQTELISFSRYMPSMHDIFIQMVNQNRPNP